MAATYLIIHSSNLLQTLPFPPPQYAIFTTASTRPHLLTRNRTRKLPRRNGIVTDMVSEDSGGGADTDPRERKRQRDKQNQREKRRRERDVVDELKRRNDSLERQVKILRDGSDKVVQHLSDTVQQLHARNEVLVKKLSRVNAFIKSWTENDLGDGQIDEVGHDGGEFGRGDGYFRESFI